MIKAEFSALLQSSVSHDPSQIILICRFTAQQTFIIINVAFWWIESSKGHLFETEIFCNITNVFLVTFHQFNASLLNKSINFFNNVFFYCSKLLNGSKNNVVMLAVISKYVLIRNANRDDFFLKHRAPCRDQINP